MPQNNYMRPCKCKRKYIHYNMINVSVKNLDWNCMLYIWPLGTHCRNLNIGFVTKWKVQGLMMSKECVRMWNKLSQMGESAKDGPQWLPNALPFCELHLGRGPKCSKSWLKRQTSTKLRPQSTIRKVLKCRCLKCLFIIHLNIRNMSYDQNKGWESNWEFDY
jgi:hypothetical protein